MPGDRPPDAVVGQREGRATGARELPFEQTIERIPGLLAIDARRGCRRLRLEVPWHQNFEGVEARVDQEVEDRQLCQLRLMRFLWPRPVRDAPSQTGRVRSKARSVLRFRTQRGPVRLVVEIAG